MQASRREAVSPELKDATFVGWRNILTGEFQDVKLDPGSPWVPVYVSEMPQWKYLKIEGFCLHRSYGPNPCTNKAVAYNYVGKKSCRWHLTEEKVVGKM